ncbi:hypothetical protein GCM10027346_14210 [Hymenobacter seoulensis]
MNHETAYKARSRYPVPSTIGSESEATLRGRIRPRQDPVAPNYLPKEYQPLDDTVTEAKGLAQNGDATGAYAGSF